MGERRGYEGEGKGVGESLRGYEGGSSASGMHRQRDAIGCGVLAAPPPFPLPSSLPLPPQTEPHPALILGLKVVEELRVPPVVPLHTPDAI